MSWPLRGTSRDTHTTTGRSPSPYRARSSARATSSGANRSVSTPGGRCSSAASRAERRGEPAAGVPADIGDHVGAGPDAAQRRSGQRQHRPADLVAVRAGDHAAGPRVAGQRRHQRQRRGGAEPHRVGVVRGRSACASGPPPTARAASTCRGGAPRRVPGLAGLNIKVVGTLPVRRVDRQRVRARPRPDGRPVPSGRTGCRRGAAESHW